MQETDATLHVTRWRDPARFRAPHKCRNSRQYVAFMRCSTGTCSGDSCRFRGEIAFVSKGKSLHLPLAFGFWVQHISLTGPEGSSMKSFKCFAMAALVAFALMASKASA